MFLKWIGGVHCDGQISYKMYGAASSSQNVSADWDPISLHLVINSMAKASVEINKLIYIDWNVLKDSLVGREACDQYVIMQAIVAVGLCLLDFLKYPQISERFFVGGVGLY